MKRYLLEMFYGIFITLALAELMQGAWRISVWLHEPIEQIFVAGATICYVLIRVLKDQEFEKGAG